LIRFEKFTRKRHRDIGLRCLSLRSGDSGNRGPAFREIIESAAEIGNPGGIGESVIGIVGLAEGIRDIASNRQTSASNRQIPREDWSTGGIYRPVFITNRSIGSASFDKTKDSRTPVMIRFRGHFKRDSRMKT